MHEPQIMMPVTCPQCGIESLCSLTVAVAADAPSPPAYSVLRHIYGEDLRSSTPLYSIPLFLGHRRVHGERPWRNSRLGPLAVAPCWWPAHTQMTRYSAQAA